MKHVLIVDDEEEFLLTMQAGFEPYKDRFEVLTALNGKEAVKVLESTRINLVVTDLKMPEMDGFELLAFIKSNFPEIPAIVMTAFATPGMETELRQAGNIRMLEKPVDFGELTQLILSFLELDLAGGVLAGISLVSFLQLVEMEQKTCLMEVKGADGVQGLIYFKEGVLYDALLGKTHGKEAALSILEFEDVKIRFRSLPSKKFKRRIKTRLMNLLMESARQKDEKGLSKDSEISKRGKSSDLGAVKNNNENIEKGEVKMADIKEVLEKFKDIDGFQAVGAFSPNGEMVAECNTAGINLGELGALANDVLLKAQKTTEIMDVGRGQLVHVEAPKAHVI
ncbi:response regulator, partial [Thermodesulfobacteriota bacterium]